MRVADRTPEPAIEKANAQNVRFCNGPWCQVAPVVSCRRLLASVRGQLERCHIIRSEEAVSPSFQRRVSGSDCGHCGFTIFTVPAVGLRARLASWPDLLSSPPQAVTAASLLQRKLVPSTHMRWRMTPSLRARATRAFLAPRRLATAIAQLLSGDIRTVRLSITLAAS